MQKHALTLAISLVLMSLPAYAATANVQSRSNILVIMADDLGWSDITPYGSEIDTPYLSDLAEQGGEL